MNTKSILLVAPPFIPTSPNSVAGIEQVTYALGKALHEQGHSVHTIAREDSNVYGTLIPGGFQNNPAKKGAELEHFHQAMAHTTSVVGKTIKGISLDTIIDRCQGISLPTTIEINGPRVVCALDMEPKYFLAFQYFQQLREKFEKRDDQFSAVSNHTAQDYTKQLKLEDLTTRMNVIHNGIVTENFPFSPTPDNYLLYLGRIRKGKAPHLAIKAALETGHEIIVAGGNNPGTEDDQYEDAEYFRKEIKPLFCQNVEWYGSANLKDKVELMQGAKGLIFPSQHKESFPLVPLETMACGTPIIAYNHSGARESIIDKKTGFLVDSFDAIKIAIERISDIDRKECAKHVRNKFDYSLMGEKYIKLIT